MGCLVYLSIRGNGGWEEREILEFGWREDNYMELIFLLIILRFIFVFIVIEKK